MNIIKSSVFETRKFLKTRYYFNKDEEKECNESILWTNKNLSNKEKQTNTKFDTFVQLIYHAGDLTDCYRYGLLYSHFLNQGFNKSKSKKNNKSNKIVKSKLYSNINILTTHNTFNYLFYKFKKGIYVQIKNNKLKVFLPFSNYYYRNSWYRYLYVNDEDKKLLDEMYKIEKELVVQKDVNDIAIDTKEKFNKYKRFKILEHKANKIFKKFSIKNGYKRLLSNRRRWYANNCFFRNSSPMWEGDKLVNIYLHILETLVESRKVSDVEFFMNLRDFPLLRNDLTEPYDYIYGKGVDIENRFRHKNYTPILGYNSHKDFSDIAMVTYDDWNNVSDYIYQESCKNSNYDMINKFQLDWNKKISKVVFRGGATGCGTSNIDNIRLKALSMSRDKTVNKNDILDIGITNWKIRLMKEKNGFKMKKSHGEKANFLTPIEQSNYKYILHLDGHVGAVRLSTELAMRSVVLIPESDYHMWFQHKLVPYKHFIPIKRDLSNLMDQVKWCIKNDNKCKKIASNARTFFELELNKDAILDHLQLTLQEIHNNTASVPDKSYDTKPAIIVPFRDTGGKRGEQLKTFLKVMTLLLKNYNYHIYIIEQSHDNNKFNRGYLLNIGYDIAKNNSHTHYIFHDVDLLPSYKLLKYYMKYPSSPLCLANKGLRYDKPTFYAIDNTNIFKDRYILKDNPFLGAVFSINGKDFEKINGYPNDFWGWGGEDNELEHRISYHKMRVNVPLEGRLIDIEEDDNISLSIEQKMNILRKNNDKEMLKREKLKSHAKNKHIYGLSNLIYNILKQVVKTDKSTIFTVKLTKNI
jgi:hypothetical protein